MAAGGGGGSSALPGGAPAPPARAASAGAGARPRGWVVGCWGGGERRGRGREALSLPCDCLLSQPPACLTYTHPHVSRTHTLAAPPPHPQPTAAAALAARLVELRDSLPGLDLGAVLAPSPDLLLRLTPAAAAAALGELRAALGPSPPLPAERLVEREPLLLLADLPALLGELRRLLPGQDPAQARAGGWGGGGGAGGGGEVLGGGGGGGPCVCVVECPPLPSPPLSPPHPSHPLAHPQVLARDPGMVLDMQSAGLQASLTIDDGIPAP